MAKSLYCVLALTMVMGCSGSECPSGTSRVGESCVGADASSNLDTGPTPDANVDAFSLFDAFAPDAGADAYIPDSGTDGGICSRCPSETPACLGGTSCVQCTAENTTVCETDTPACDTDTNTCVQCNTSTDCAGRAATPICNVDTHTCVPCMGAATGACGGVTPACDTNNTCTCTAMSCTSLTAARCDEGSNSCAPCMADTDCARFGATPACNEATGACVPCMPDNETACGLNSCNPMTRTCTTTPRNSLGTCLTCVADSECIGAAASAATCAQVNILGVTGNYCLPRLASDTAFCTQPLFDRVVGGTSASGSRATYCRHRTTTCEAFLHHSETGDGTCTGLGGTDAACGTTSTPADGYCRLSGGGNRCTIPCTSSDDCPIGVVCNAVADALAGRRLCAL